jgi:uncharacterized protein YggT (Ycf19 family)
MQIIDTNNKEVLIMNVRYIAVSLLNFFTTIVLGLLGLRFFLRLFGANESVAFVSWVYETSAVLLQPFRGIFPTTTFENEFVLELSTIFAMIVYAILALVLLWLINLVAPEPVEERPAPKRRK